MPVYCAYCPEEATRKFWLVSGGFKDCCDFHYEVAQRRRAEAIERHQQDMPRVAVK